MPDIIYNPFKSISILYRKSHIWLNDGCAQYALTAAQAVVILIVCDFKVLTQDALVKRLSLDKSVIAKTVTKLEDMGFVFRNINMKDKRTFEIRPTPKAWEVHPLIKEQLDVCFNRMTQRMTAAEREEFERLLILATEASISLDD